MFARSRTLESRKASAPPGSYSAKLFTDPKLLAAKILEEARELVEAKDADETAWECADLFYFAAGACMETPRLRLYARVGHNILNAFYFNSCSLLLS